LTPVTGWFPGRKETSRNRSVIHRLVVVYQEYERDRVGIKTEAIIPSSRVILIIVLVLAFSRLAFSGEIHDAARSDDLEKVQELLAEDPSLVSSRDDLTWTPLHYAAAYGYRDVAQLLLARNAEVDARDDLGWTPLHVAAVNGNKDVVELLLASKAHVNAKTNRGLTPLSLALDKDHHEVAELLRRHGGEE